MRNVIFWVILERYFERYSRDGADDQSLSFFIPFLCSTILYRWRQFPNFTVIYYLSYLYVIFNICVQETILIFNKFLLSCLTYWFKLIYRSISYLHLFENSNTFIPKIFRINREWKLLLHNLLYSLYKIYNNVTSN